MISLKYVPTKQYPNKSSKVFGACHLIFNSEAEQVDVMKLSNIFPKPYTDKTSIFAGGGCTLNGCTRHVEYLSNYYPIYYRRKLIEKRRSLYTRSNWESTIVRFIFKSSFNSNRYIEYPILFDYDGNVRIPEFYYFDIIRGDGERVCSYRVSNFN